MLEPLTLEHKVAKVHAENGRVYQMSSLDRKYWEKILILVAAKADDRSAMMTLSQVRKQAILAANDLILRYERALQEIFEDPESAKQIASATLKFKGVV